MYFIKIICNRQTQSTVRQNLWNLGKWKIFLFFFQKKYVKPKADSRFALGLDFDWAISTYENVLIKANPL